MVESGAEDWLRELERPTRDFFRCFNAQIQVRGPGELVREAVLHLVPQVHWAAYLPYVPHGLPGLRGVLRLRPLLAQASFLRLLATQLHALAQEQRCPAGRGLDAIGRGSGSWDNLALALAQHRPAIAWGEARCLAAEPEPFRRLERAVEPDMANVGHKLVLARMFGDLAQDLGGGEAGSVLLALTAWLAASEPADRFWHDRARRRLGEAPPVPWLPATPGGAGQAALAREVCDAGLVELLDRFSARVLDGAGAGDLLSALVLAAAERQLDARRDLEGKTCWNFVYLAVLAQRAAEQGQSAPASWVQAAALVNLFPGGEAEDRPRPAAQGRPEGLLDAILDGEPELAMASARALLAAQGPERVLSALAEAASRNDPVFNQSHQVLAVAAGADLVPLLPAPAAAALLEALAKSLGNSQGSGDLGALADAALMAQVK